MMYVIAGGSLVSNASRGYVKIPGPPSFEDWPDRLYKSVPPRSLLP